MTKEVLQIDVTQGTEIIRPMNDEELANHELGKKGQEERLAIKVEIEAKKAAARKKLGDLGLTVDDLQSLGL